MTSIPPIATDDVAPAIRSADLLADCDRCCGLCCVATSFPQGDDFAFSKAPHEPCRHLCADHKCGIHDELVPRGFPGCVAYDCAGAGQRITQETFGGRSWQDLDDPREMFEAFSVMRVLCEQLQLLEGARALALAEPFAEEIDALAAELESAAALDAGELRGLEPEPLKKRCRGLLQEIGAQHREARPTALPVLHAE